MISYESLSDLIGELQGLATTWKGTFPLPEAVQESREAFLLDCERSQAFRFAGKRLQEALDRLFEPE